MADNAKNYTSLSTDALPSGEAKGSGQKKKNDIRTIIKRLDKKNVVNLFLICAVLLFVASLVYSLRTNTATTDTQASDIQTTPILTITPPPSNANEEPPFLVQQLQEYPVSYDGQSIPDSLYEEIQTAYTDSDPKKVQEYTVQLVGQYYILNDVLQQNEIYSSAAAQLDENGMTYQGLVTAVPELISLAEDNLVSTIDYAIVIARVAGPNVEHSTRVRERFSEDEIRIEAETLINTYQQRFTEEPTNYETIIEEANQDEELVFLSLDNFSLINRDQTIEDDLFFTDPSFNDFLFTLTEGDVSDLRVIRDGDIEIAYVTVFPIQINATEYDSLEEIYQQNISLFN